MSTIHAEQEKARFRGNGPKAVIHLSLQGKGNVRKPLIASIIAKCYIHRGALVRRIDIDPVNQMLCPYSVLRAQAPQILTNGNVDQRGFGALMERLAP